jgi:SAM-dependent methyltransferase
LNGSVTTEREVFPARWLEDEPSAETGGLVERLRADLAAAGYTVAGVEAFWRARSAGLSVDPGEALRRGHRVPAVRALELAAEGDEAIAALIGLFLLGLAQPAAALASALPTLGVESAVALGLVTPVDRGLASGERFAPLVDIRPYAFADASGHGEWWIASDPGELATGGALPEDHVLGVGGASMTLSGLLMQRPARRTLDLGTGSGIQALHASRFSDRVIATDVSARALAFARFTARLNGIASISFRLGSLYEPVAGERFDRIVSNPPFVITPRRDGVPAYEYRDGGLVGDALVEAVLRGAADHLAPGGIAQFLANWEVHPDADGLDRVASWLDEAGLEYWIVEREVLDASRYAETWIRDGGTRAGTPEFDLLHDAWLQDFADRGVTGVGFGYVLLRVPEDGEPRLRRTERLHGSAGENPGGLGAHLSDVLAGDDALLAVDDDGLRALAVEIAPDVTEERHHWPGAEQPTVILLRQGGGFGRTIDTGTALAALVGAADGSLPLGVLTDAIAGLLDADAEALWAELAPQVRELVHGGLLRPVTG